MSPTLPDTLESGPIPLLDIIAANTSLQPEINAAIRDVISSGRFLNGPACSDFEQQMAEFCGTRHAVGCASGSDALLLSMMALDIGPGDEVIVPSFTFFATASCVSRLGATPVFADIEADSFNIAPASVAALITDRTKAVIPVHLFGQCADIDQLRAITEPRGIALIEDAAQAIGAAVGRHRAGSLALAGCFSFYPTKNLGGFGDGGMLTTNDEALAERLRTLASHGMKPRYFHSMVGIASRLDTIQAAVLSVKLRHVETWNRQRRENAARYHQLAAAAGLENHIRLPRSGAQREHAWNQFTIRIPEGNRDAVRRHLGDRGIGSEVYYPVPLHLQECYAYLGYRPGALPETERAAAEVLSLPIYPELGAAAQARVVRQLVAYFVGEGRSAA